MIKWLITTLILWSFASLIHANLFHDSNLDWETIETEHFYLHFHDGEEQLVRDFLPTANSVHKDVTEFLSWTPVDKTHVVFTDEFDLSNGFATVFPRNNTHIFLAAPDDIFSLEDHNGWLELVFRHEYLHIVHLDKGRGAPLGVRKVLGRHPFLFPVAFPNAFQPNWYIEGLATYYETDHELGIGRGQSSYFDMLMRMEMIGGLKGIRQINQPIGTWPSGSIPYLYGVHHHQFIQEKYGEKKIKSLVEGLSDNFVPYRIDSNTKYVFGKDLDRLWFEFEKYLHEKYDPLIAEVKAEGVREGVALSDIGYSAESLQAIDDQAYYVAFDGRSHHALMRSQAGQPPEKLRDITFGARLDIHKEKGILVSQPERCRNARIYYDIYRMDLDGGDFNRLTHCARFRFAVWTNTGDKIIAVHNELGVNSLQLLDENAKHIKTLWTGEQGEQISHPSYSPTGNYIVASVWRKDLGWNIEKFDVAESQWIAVTRDKFLQAQPSYLADGQSIIYISDDNGVYNVYKLNLETNERSKLTNVISGAFTPALTPNGLYYLGYRPQGFDLFHMKDVAEVVVDNEPQHEDVVAETDMSIQTEAGPFLLATPIETIETETTATTIADKTTQPETQLEAEDYSPWSSMSPTWWLPTILVDDQQTELGFQTLNYDALFRHSYALSLSYDFENNWVNGAFDYIYDGFWPLLHFGISRSSDLFINSNDETDRIRSDAQAIAEIIIPFNTVDSTFATHIAALTTREKDRYLANGVSPLPDTREDIAAIGIRYTSAQRYPLSVSRNGGRALSLVYEDTDAIGESDRKGQVTVGEWREFYRIAGEHTVAFRLVEGHGRNTTKPFRLGGIQDFYADHGGFIFSPEPLFNKRDYSLRGYSEGRQELIGKNMRLVSFEYRFPLSRIEHGWMVPPFGFNQIHGTVFFDTGGVWGDDRSDPETYYDSVGFEFNTEMDLFYSVRFHLTLGLASGLDSVIGEDKAYLRVGHQF